MLIIGNNYKVLTNRLLTKKKKERIWEVDFLRCLPIILVILYHICYDLNSLPLVITNYSDLIEDHKNLADFVKFCTSITNNTFINYYLVSFFGGVFLFVCGISTELSKNNIKRGILLSLGGLVISLGSWLASYILDDDLFICFGVINLMGLVILIYSLVELFFKKVLKKEISSFSCLTLGILIFLIGNILNQIGYKNSYGLFTHWPVDVYYGGPIKMYEKNPWSFILSALGYYGNVVDWWPIFPFAGVILVGIAFGKVLYGKEKKTKFPKVNKKIVEPFCFIGRHTLLIYLLHQFVIVLILAAILLPMGAKVQWLSA